LGGGGGPQSQSGQRGDSVQLLWYNESTIYTNFEA
jgi:hypothetical protein